MKKLKLIMALIAVLIYSNITFAENPIKKDYTKNIAENMIKSLCRDINLTDSQKLAVQTMAKEYEVKLQNLSLQSKSESKKEMNEQAVLEYRSKLDNILIQDQIEKLKTKRIERMESALNNNKTKN